MKENSRFSPEHEEEQLDDYAPLSALSMIALIFGVLGALTATKSFFLFLPFIAIVLSIVALIRMKLSDRKVIGWTVAYIALFLGIFFAVSRISYERFRAYQISKDAVSISEDWLGYISRGELYEAHQLTQTFYKRQYPGVSLYKLYNSPPNFGPDMSDSEKELARESSPKGKLKVFRETQPLATIIDHAENATFEFVKTLWHNRKDLNEDQVDQLWKMKYEHEGKPVAIEFVVSAHRVDMGYYFGAHWYIERVGEPRD